MKKILAVFLAAVLACSSLILAFGAVDDGDSVSGVATQDEAGAKQKTITDFEITQLPDKVFSEPFDGKKSMKIRSEEIESGGRSMDGPQMQYIKSTSVAYNMKGAIAKIYQSDGTSYEYQFEEPFWIDFDYEIPAAFYWLSEQNYEPPYWIVEDYGNYQAEVSILISDNEEIKKTITARNTSQLEKEDDLTPSDNSGNIPQSTVIASDKAIKTDKAATKDESSNESASANSDNHAIATGTSPLAISILIVLTVIAGAFLAYFTRGKHTIL